jgi:hypothetical protein
MRRWVGRWIASRARRTARRRVAALAVGLVLALGAAQIVWVRPGAPFAGLAAGRATVLVAREGSWEETPLQGDVARGTVGALRLVRRRDALPGTPPAEPASGPAYRIVVGDAAMVYRPNPGILEFRGRLYRPPAPAQLALRQAVAEAERRFHAELVTPTCSR